MTRAELEEPAVETVEIEVTDTVIETVEKAIALLDSALASTAGHSIVAASEMSDLLLDVRLLLSPLVA